MENTNFGYSEVYFAPVEAFHIPELNYNEGEGIKGVVGESMDFNQEAPKTVIHSAYQERVEDAEFEVVGDDNWKRGTWPVTQTFVSEDNCNFVPGTGKEVCKEGVKPGDCVTFGNYVCDEQCQLCIDLEQSVNPQYEDPEPDEDNDQIEEPVNFECGNALGGIPSMRCATECEVCKEARLDGIIEKSKKGMLHPELIALPEALLIPREDVDDEDAYEGQERFECFNSEVGAHRCSVQCQDCYDHQHAEGEDEIEEPLFHKNVEAEFQKLNSYPKKLSFRCGEITLPREGNACGGLRGQEPGDRSAMKP